MIPFVDLKAQYLSIKADVDGAIQGVLDSCQFTLGSEKMSLGGFQAVDRAKLKALSGEALAQLAATDELELIYLHLQSLRNFNTLKDRLAPVQAAA